MIDPTFLLMIVAFGALMYFLTIRPQQKRMKAHQETLSALTPGTRILLTSGVFATLRHIGERQAIVELAPGVEVTIVKGNIARVATPEEEEFEFSDDADVDGVVVLDDVQGEEFDADAANNLDESVDSAAQPDVTFDPRSDEDISAEELQRRFDN